MDNKFSRLIRQGTEEGLKSVRRDGQAAFLNVFSEVRWIAMAILVGIVVGFFSGSFAYCLILVTELRYHHPWLLYLLPLGGIVIVYLYHICGGDRDKGTNALFSAMHEDDVDVPFYMAPVIYVSTLITHLLGGSAGREGAALQMGGSIGNTIGRLLHLDEGDRKILVMSGMSAAFSAVFGTPLAATIFPMEMVSVGIMQYSALVPCLFAAIVANGSARQIGLSSEEYMIFHMPSMTIANVLKIVILASMCAGLSILFVRSLRQAGRLYHRFFSNPYLRVAAGGLLLIIMTKMVGNMIYNGAGVELIDHAIREETPTFAFLLKMLFTSVTLAAGYKGGEIVPAFTIGATFGCLFGTVFGISPSLCAAAGMLSLFCGVTNCPISSMLIGFELFGFEGVRFLLIAISISYMLSGYSGLYKEQIIVYSKFHPKYINRFSGDDSFEGEDYED
ncbi:MAG: chloride channel protein [Eubacterium sp.]|nr:chloride channel protein [Eubacterium sp.]